MKFLEQQKKIKAIEKSISQLRDWGARGDNEKFFKEQPVCKSCLIKFKE